MGRTPTARPTLVKGHVVQTGPTPAIGQKRPPAPAMGVVAAQSTHEGWVAHDRSCNGGRGRDGNCDGGRGRDRSRGGGRCRDSRCDGDRDMGRSYGSICDRGRDIQAVLFVGSAAIVPRRLAAAGLIVAGSAVTF
jgi:hypothetical protein